VEQRLRDLLGDEDGEIRPQLQALYHALATADRPGTVAAWLGKSAAPAILDGLDPARQLTHPVLTTGHIQASGNNISIRLGREPVALPEPLNALALQLVAARHGHAAIGGQQTSPWLFPGGQPGRRISACQLAERLRQLGVQSGQSRSAALFQLATAGATQRHAKRHFRRYVASLPARAGTKSGNCTWPS
jgi:hypothetical protein